MTKSKRGLSRIKQLFQGDRLPVTDVLPVKNITADGFLVDKNNHYQAFINVKTNDLYSMNDDDLNRLVLGFTNLLRIYTNPIKIISLSYPSETREQQKYLTLQIEEYMDLLNRTDLKERTREELINKRDRAEEQLNTMKWVGKNLKDLKFIMICYGRSVDELNENLRSLMRLGQRQFGLEQIKSPQQVLYLVKRLNNMNLDS